MSQLGQFVTMLISSLVS